MLAGSVVSPSESLLQTLKDVASGASAEPSKPATVEAFGLQLQWIHRNRAAPHFLQGILGSSDFFLVSLLSEENDVPASEPECQLPCVHAGPVYKSDAVLFPQESRIDSLTPFPDSILTPVPITMARKIMALLLGIQGSSDIPAVPFVIVCETFTQGTEYMGYWPSAASLKETTAGLLRAPFKIIHAGFVDPEKPNSIPSLAGITSDMIARKNLTQEDIKLNFSSNYDILPKSVYREDSCRISVRFDWEGSSGEGDILSKPALESTVTLNVEFSNGELDPENHMASASIQKQVQTLKHWNSLVQEGAELEVNLNKDSKQTPLSYKVKSFIEDVANMGRTSQTRRSTPTTTMEGNNSDSLALFATFDQRKDLDFSDLFWDFAAQATSSKDLKEIMTAIVEELETGRLKPLVHKANQSSFSRTLQDWVSLSLLTTCADLDERKNAIMNVFDFWVESPLESLIEVGIRKITGDLTHHLVVNNLANVSQLEYFLDASLSLEDQILRLEQLMAIIQLSLLVSSHVLSLPHESHRLLIERVLKTFSTTSQKESTERMDRFVCTLGLPKFSNQVTKWISTVVAGFECHDWTVKLEASDAVEIVHLVKSDCVTALHSQDQSAEEWSNDNGAKWSLFHLKG